MRLGGVRQVVAKLVACTVVPRAPTVAPPVTSSSERQPSPIFGKVWGLPCWPSLVAQSTSRKRLLDRHKGVRPLPRTTASLAAKTSLAWPQNCVGVEDELKDLNVKSRSSR